GIDALADMFPTISPMAFSYNSPLKFNDPLGLNPCPDGNCDDVIPTNTSVEVVVTAQRSKKSFSVNYNLLLFSSNPIHRAIGRVRKDHNRNFMSHVVHNKIIHYHHWDYLTEISRTDNSGGLWQKIAAGGIGGSMLATTGSPLLIETLGSNITQFGVNAGFSAGKASH
ncbi:MAG: hypothetical protein AAGC64_12430, partial [Bacteroidota bacterium]